MSHTIACSAQGQHQTLTKSAAKQHRDVTRRPAENLNMYLLSSLLITAAMSATAPEGGAGTTRPPNILFILADDVGQEVLECYGGSSYHTPHIDSLARDGMKFHHAYSMPLCYPTRIALMTGRYRVRLNQPTWGNFPAAAESSTFPGFLQRAGYATAIAGKWQLALLKRDPHHPQRLGFDQSSLFAWHEGPRYYDPLIWQNGKLRKNLAGHYGPDVYADFLIDFMKQKRETPFLAYFSMALCHDVTNDLEQPVPFGPGKTRYDDYAEMVRQMDRVVGRLLTALETARLRDNTVVHFHHRQRDTQALDRRCAKWSGSTVNPSSHYGAASRFQVAKATSATMEHAFHCWSAGRVSHRPEVRSTRWSTAVTSCPHYSSWPGSNHRPISNSTATALPRY